MYLYRACLLVVEYRCVYCLSILDLDFLFVSHKISVWYCFLILDNFVCTNRNVLKLSNAVLISYRRNINLTSCVRCTSEIELDTLNILLPLCSLVNSDRTCLFLVEYRCVYCLSILDLDFLFISDKISVRNCFLVLDYHVSADWDIFKLCYAVLVCDRRNINLTSCVRCSSQVELDTLDVSLSLSSLMNYDRTCFLDILKSDFCCFVVFNCYFLLISSEVSRRNC